MSLVNKIILFLLLSVIPAQAQLRNYLSALEGDSATVLLGRPTGSTNIKTIITDFSVSVDSILSSLQDYGQNIDNYTSVANAIADAKSRSRVLWRPYHSLFKDSTVTISASDSITFFDFRPDANGGFKIGGVQRVTFDSLALPASTIDNINEFSVSTWNSATVATFASASDTVLIRDATDGSLKKAVINTSPGTGEWTDFGTYLRPNEDADVAIHLTDTDNTDSLIIAIDSAGGITFTTTTGNIIWSTGNNGDGSFVLPASSIGSAEIGVDVVQLTDLDDDSNPAVAGQLLVVEAGAVSVDYVQPTDGIIITNDSIRIHLGIDSGLELRTGAGNLDSLAIDTTRIATIADVNAVSAGSGDSSFTSIDIDTINNNINTAATNIIITDTMTVAVITGKTTGNLVWADTSNQLATDADLGSYLLLSAILDSLNNYDGDITFTQGNTTYKNFLDSLNNYNGKVLFTQGNTGFVTGAVDSIGKLSVDLWNTATVATFAGGADTVLFRDATNGNLVKGIISTSGMSAAAFFDSLNNYNGVIDFTQTGVGNNSALKTGAIDSIGKLGVDLFNTAAFVSYSSDTVLIRDVTDGALKKTIISASGMSAAAFNDSLNNYDGTVVFTQGNSTVNSTDGIINTTDSLRLLLSTESNLTIKSGATAIDSLEVDTTRIATNSDVTTATANYLLLSAILDTLNNYDGDITFTQGNTTLANLLDSLNNYNGTVVFTQGNSTVNSTDGVINTSDSLRLNLRRDSGLAIKAGASAVDSVGVDTTRIATQSDLTTTGANYLLLSAILDTLNNYDGDITFTQGLTTYKNFLDSLNNYDGDVLFTQGTTGLNTDAVSANELNATGVEAELEAVLDLPELQGLLLSTQVDSVGGNGIVTNTTGDANYLQLSDILDSLNNYDSDITFTQGVAAITNNSVVGEDFQTGAIDSIGYLGKGLWNTATVATFASGADTVLFRDATDGSLAKGVITTGGGLGDSSFTSIDVDTINNNINAAATNIVVTDTLRVPGVFIGATSGGGDLLDLTSTTVTEQMVDLDLTLGDGTGLAANYSPIQLQFDWTGTDIDSNIIVSTGIRSQTHFGKSGAQATGIVHGFTSEIVSFGEGTVTGASEYAPYFAALRLDYGPDFTDTSGPTGRAWLTDFNLHGSVQIQPDMLNGITMFTNNYYNGSPDDSPSGGMWLVTKKGSGGSRSASHDTASTYPVDVGIGIVGTSVGTSSEGEGLGFTTGIQIGGYGSGWKQTATDSSKIGTGIDITDYVSFGVLFDNPHTAATDSVPAIAVDSLGGYVGIGLRDPWRPLHIRGSDGRVAGYPSGLGAKDFIVLENNGNSNISLVGGASSGTGIKFFDSGATGNIGFINYDHSTDVMQFATTDGTVEMYVNSSGVGIGGSPASAFQIFAPAGVSDPLVNFVGSNATDAFSVKTQNSAGSFDFAIVGGGDQFLTGSTQGDGVIRYSAGDNLLIGEDAGVVGIFLEAGGQVGIGGNLAPGAALDVTGAIIASTTLTVGAAQINGAKISVDGDANQEQFAIQGHSTQTLPLIHLENSAGETLVTLADSGQARMSIGGAWQTLTRAGGSIAYPLFQVHESGKTDTLAFALITSDGTTGATSLHANTATNATGIGHDVWTSRDSDGNQSLAYRMLVDRSGTIGSNLMPTEITHQMGSATVAGGIDFVKWFGSTGNITYGGGDYASNVWTYSLSGATDPVWTIGDNSMDLSTGVLKEGGNNVLTTSDGLQLADVLDTLNNYDGNVLFTQGNTALNTNAVDNINELSVALWNTASVVTFASGADTVLIRDATDNALKKAIITTGSALNVREDDGSPSISNVDSIYFDAPDFVLTNPTNNRVLVALNTDGLRSGLVKTIIDTVQIDSFALGQAVGVFTLDSIKVVVDVDTVNILMEHRADITQQGTTVLSSTQIPGSKSVSSFSVSTIPANRLLYFEVVSIGGNVTTAPNADLLTVTVYGRDGSGRYVEDRVGFSFVNPDSIINNSNTDTLLLGWTNDHGTSVIVDSIRGWADASGLSISLIEWNADYGNPTLIDVVTPTTAKGNFFKQTETTITAGTIENGASLGVLFGSTDVSQGGFVMYYHYSTN